MSNRLAELRIDDATWHSAGPARRAEWRGAIHDLIHDGFFTLPDRSDAPPPPHRARITLGPAQLFIEVEGADGRAAARSALPLAVIRPYVDEYINICKEMSKGLGPGSPRLEALDIAKRLSHDEAGETVMRLCRPLGADHATARRIFTLLVALLYDTTALVVRPHHVR